MVELLDSMRLWEVVVKKRFWGVWSWQSFDARAIFWRQGRHTDLKKGSRNRECFIIAGV